MIPAAVTAVSWVGVLKWDARPLLRRVGNDLELAAQVIGIFLDELPDLTAGIRGAAQAQDAVGLAASTRAFQCSAAAIGADEWGQTAEALAQAGPTGSDEELEAALESFERRAARLESQLLEALGR